MSTKVKITKSDVLRSKILEAAWYPATVKALSEEVASSGESTNYITDFVVDSPPALAGTPIRHWFNDGDAGRSTWPAFFNAFGAQINENMKEDVEVDFQLTIGKSLEIYVQPGENPKNKKAVNQIIDFRRKR